MALMHSMMVKILLIYLMSGCHKANGRCRSAKGTCPSDWNQWGDNCYKVIDEKRPWSEARDECVRIGGVMATPNTLEEGDHIKRLTSGDLYTWINCNDLETEGIWECNELGTTVILFRNWKDDQPNGEAAQNCAVIKSRLSWEMHDMPCSNDYPAVCKQPVPPRWQ